MSWLVLMQWRWGWGPPEGSQSFLSPPRGTGRPVLHGVLLVIFLISLPLCDSLCCPFTTRMPHFLTLPPPQDAIDQGWLMDQRSCSKGRPNMTPLLATAIEVARGLEYLHSQVSGLRGRGAGQSGTEEAPSRQPLLKPCP